MIIIIMAGIIIIIIMIIIGAPMLEIHHQLQAVEALHIPNI
jgi:hypothetical protein